MAKSLPKKWKWTYPTVRFEVLTLTFTFLVGILPFSTLRTFWGETSRKNTLYFQALMYSFSSFMVSFHSVWGSGSSHKSALRRFTHRERHFTFVIDRSHFKNHTTCHSGYNIEKRKKLISFQWSVQKNKSGMGWMGWVSSAVLHNNMSKTMLCSEINILCKRHRMLILKRCPLWLHM